MMHKIAVFVKEKRLVLGMTQSDLAEKIDPRHKGYVVKLNLKKGRIL
jgi:DNA-binding XRE family transcriptional regulator